MKKFKKYMIFFAVGGAGYAVIELLWRGHTHWTMVIAGGLCFIIFSIIARKMRRAPLVLSAAVGALAVTAVELSFGLLFNRALGMGVWDYSSQPCNICGQVCPLFSLLWWILALVFIPLSGGLDRLLDNFRRTDGGAEKAQP